MSATPGSESSSSASTDPTRTQTLRRRFLQRFNSRFQSVRGDLRETIEANDALRLAGDAPGTPAPPNPTGQLRPSDFGVATDAQRLAAVDEWFRTVLDRRVLEPQSTEAVMQGRHWSSDFINEAAARGVARATVAARQAGYEAPSTSEQAPSDVLSGERYQQALRDERLRVYQDIRKATNDTHADVLRTLGQLLAGGVALREVASGLTKRVDAVGQTAGMRISMSATVRTVNRLSLERYDDLGVEEVGAQVETVPDDGDGEGDQSDDEVEWRTAQDRSVCPQCRRLRSNVYRVVDVLSGESPMPVRDTHPSCRCWMVAVPRGE